MYWQLLLFSPSSPLLFPSQSLVASSPRALPKPLGPPLLSGVCPKKIDYQIYPTSTFTTCSYFCNMCRTLNHKMYFARELGRTFGIDYRSHWKCIECHLVIMVGNDSPLLMRTLPAEDERDQSGSAIDALYAPSERPMRDEKSVYWIGLWHMIPKKNKKRKKSRGVGCCQTTRGIERPLWFLTLHYRLYLFSFHLSSLMCVTLQSSPVASAPPHLAACSVFFLWLWCLIFPLLF